MEKSNHRGPQNVPSSLLPRLQATIHQNIILAHYILKKYNTSPLQATQSAHKTQPHTGRRRPTDTRLSTLYVFIKHLGPAGACVRMII